MPHPSHIIITVGKEQGTGDGSVGTCSLHKHLDLSPVSQSSCKSCTMAHTFHLSAGEVETGRSWWLALPTSWQALDSMRDPISRKTNVDSH